MRKLDRSLSVSELPTYARLLSVVGLGLSLRFATRGVEIVDAPGKASLSGDAWPDFDHVEPAPVLGT